MALPFYAINREELEEIITEAISTAKIKAEIKGLDDTDLTIDGNTEVIESKLTELNETLSNQEITISNLYMSVNNIMIEILTLLNINEGAIKEISKTVGFILAEKLEIKELLQHIMDLLNVRGRSKVFSINRVIADIKTTYYLNYTIPSNMVLKSISVMQTKYNYEDYWILKVNNRVIFENVYTKFTEETKFINSVLRLKAGDIIKIEYVNNSSKQKIINYDIECLLIS